jgi:hypothetical protein
LIPVAQVPKLRGHDAICSLPDFASHSVYTCKETSWGVITYPFELTPRCDDGDFGIASTDDAASADECAKNCVEDASEGVVVSVAGFHYSCDGTCLW